MPGAPMPWLLAGKEGPPSLTMAASSAAILAWRVGSVVVSAFFRFWRSVSIVLIWLDETPAAVRVAVRLAVGLLLVVPLGGPLGCKAFNWVGVSEENAFWMTAWSALAAAVRLAGISA